MPHGRVNSRPKGCLVLDLGYCRPAAYPIPERDIQLAIRNAAEGAGAKTASATPIISIFGISHLKVHQIAAEIARYRKPEVYSGKGINYDGQKFSPRDKNERK